MNSVLTFLRALPGKIYAAGAAVLAVVLGALLYMKREQDKERAKVAAEAKVRETLVARGDVHRDAADAVVAVETAHTEAVVAVEVRHAKEDAAIAAVAGTVPPPGASDTDIAAGWNDAIDAQKKDQP